ncbi:MAG TPA: hypothetical protein VFR41_11935 [Acidimicrobiia bacterium]|nr:hypothetical protein [Acidimicrobiia bacterium]
MPTASSRNGAGAAGRVVVGSTGRVVVGCGRVVLVVGAGVVGTVTVGRVFELEAPPLPHAASTTHATMTAARERTARIMPAR